MTTILGYMTMLITVAIASFIWKHGTLIVNRIHGLARTASAWAWKRSGISFEAARNERARQRFIVAYNKGLK